MFVCPVARSGLDWWPRLRRSAALLRCDALRIVSACPSASVALFRLRSAPSSTVSLLPCLLLVRRAYECAWSEWLLHTGRRCRHPPLSVRCAADQADVALLLVALLRCHHRRRLPDRRVTASILHRGEPFRWRFEFASIGCEWTSGRRSRSPSPTPPASHAFVTKQNQLEGKF